MKSSTNIGGSYLPFYHVSFDNTAAWLCFGASCGCADFCTCDVVPLLGNGVIILTSVLHHFSVSNCGLGKHIYLGGRKFQDCPNWLVFPVQSLTVSG